MDCMHQNIYDSIWRVGLHFIFKVSTYFSSVPTQSQKKKQNNEKGKPAESRREIFITKL